MSLELEIENIWTALQPSKVADGNLAARELPNHAGIFAGIDSDSSLMVLFSDSEVKP